MAGDLHIFDGDTIKDYVDSQSPAGSGYAGGYQSFYYSSVSTPTMYVQDVPGSGTNANDGPPAAEDCEIVGLGYSTTSGDSTTTLPISLRAHHGRRYEQWYPLGGAAGYTAFSSPLRVPVTGGLDIGSVP